MTGFDCIYGTTIRVWVKINGMIFKRIWDRSGLYPACWQDEEHNIGDTLAIQDQTKEQELEAIFKAYCLENKFDVVKLLISGSTK